MKLMIQKQNDERKQIQAKIQEINASTNVEKVPTIYQSAIGEIKDRLKKREEYAEKFKATMLKSTLGSEPEEEGDEEQKATEAKTSEPAPDQRAIFAQKEKEEFEPYLGLTKDDDWTEFKKKSKFWDAPKKRRFEIARLKFQTKEFEVTSLAAVKEKFRSQSSKQLKKPEWSDELMQLRKPPEPTLKVKNKDGKEEGVYKGKDLEAWIEWKKEEQNFLRMKKLREEAQKSAAKDQSDKVKRIETQPERWKQYKESIKKVKSE